MKFRLFIFVICFAPCFTIAQNENLTNQNSNSDIKGKLNRNAIYIFGIVDSNTLNKEVVNKLRNLNISQEFIDISLDDNTIQPTIHQTNVSNKNYTLYEQELIHILNENKIGQKILSDWFNRQSDNSFNFEVLKKREAVKANVDDFIKVSASKKSKLKLMEMGLKMVNQSYLLVFDFQDIKTLEEYYIQTGVDENNRILNGYMASFTCYLIKFDFNSSIASVFFQDFWLTENELSKKDKIEAFENTDFPFIALKTYKYEITSSQHNPGQPLAQEKQKTTDELLDGLAELALKNVINAIEKQDDPFNLNIMIREVSPISAKIGKKEGLKFDQPYFIYENQISKSGIIYHKRIGVVKSKKVVDNRKDSLIQTQNSAFYQIAGNPISEGMLLEKYNDLGVNLFLGNAFSGLPGFTGRIEYYFSKMFDDMISPGKTASGSTSFKVYLSGGYNQKTYIINENYLNHTFIRGCLGVSKDFYPLRFLHWSPFLGYGLESVRCEGTKNIVSSNFSEMGIQLGINLKYNIQLILSYNYYHFFNSILLDGNKEVLDENFNYNDNYKDRSNSGISLGIRIML